MTVYITKKEALALVKQDGAQLQLLPYELRDDEDIVLLAVKQNGYALQYASTRLCDNLDVVMAAVNSDGYALTCASKRLQYNMEIVLTALWEKTIAYHCMPKSLYADERVIFMRKYKNSIKPEDWPIIKKAILINFDSFLKPDPVISTLTEGMEYPYLLLAQYALSKDVIIEPESYPELNINV